MPASTSTSAHPNPGSSRPFTPSATDPNSHQYPSSSIAYNPNSYQSSAPPTASMSSSQLNRNRQYTHLHAQLATLNAHLADLENLVGMTAVQAEYVRGLGAWWGGAFMAASKVLGEEAATGAGAGAGGEGSGK